MRLGRYEVDNELGRGSFGTVFKARHYKTGKTVAIKAVENTGPEEATNQEVDVLKVWLTFI